MWITLHWPRTKCLLVLSMFQLETKSPWLVDVLAFVASYKLPISGHAERNYNDPANRYRGTWSRRSEFAVENEARGPCWMFWGLLIRISKELVFTANCIVALGGDSLGGQRRGHLTHESLARTRASYLVSLAIYSPGRASWEMVPCGSSICNKNMENGRS